MTDPSSATTVEESRKRGSYGDLWAIAAIITATFVFLGLYLEGLNPLTYPYAQGELIKHAEQSVANSLRDPESANFRDVVARFDSVCGQVNGKNAFGGYGGYKRFYVTSVAGYEEVEIDRAESISPTDPFNERWSILCVDQPSNGSAASGRN